MSETPDYRGRETVPVVQVIFAAWQFFLSNVKSLYIYGAPFILTSGAMAWVNAFVSLKNPAAMLVMPFMVLSWMFFWMMSAAQYRLALGLPEKGLAGLDFGYDEFRLFATSMLVWLVALIVAVAVAVGLLASFFISGILMSGIDPNDIPAGFADQLQFFLQHDKARFFTTLALLAVVVWVMMLYLFSRFAPAFPASIAEKRVIVFEASNWTKGEGIRIAIAFVLAILPIYVLKLPDIWGGLQIMKQTMILAADKTPAEINALSQAATQSRFGWQILTVLLVPALNALRVGLYVALYRGLRPLEE